ADRCTVVVVATTPPCAAPAARAAGAPGTVERDAASRSEDAALARASRPDDVPHATSSRDAAAALVAASHGFGRRWFNGGSFGAVTMAAVFRPALRAARRRRLRCDRGRGACAWRWPGATSPSQGSRTGLDRPR